LVDRLFGGRPDQLVVGLLDDESLTRAELERLRSAIESRLKTDGPNKSRKRDG
jgi:hypothetical protein